MVHLVMFGMLLNWDDKKVRPVQLLNSAKTAVELKYFTNNRERFVSESFHGQSSTKFGMAMVD